MTAETDPLPKLRAKLDELEAQVRQRLSLAVDRTSPLQSWTTLIDNRDTLPQPPTRLDGNAAAVESEKPSKSFLSRIARFFGVGR